MVACRLAATCRFALGLRDIPVWRHLHLLVKQVVRPMIHSRMAPHPIVANGSETDPCQVRHPLPIMRNRATMLGDKQIRPCQDNQDLATRESGVRTGQILDKCNHHLDLVDLSHQVQEALAWLIPVLHQLHQTLGNQVHGQDSQVSIQCEVGKGMQGNLHKSQAAIPGKTMGDLSKIIAILGEHNDNHMEMTTGKILAKQGANQEAI